MARALKDGRDAVADEIEASNAAVASRNSDPRLHNNQARARIDSITASGAHRGPAAERREAQNARLHLPLLPTTTIGSFPQTGEIRRSRAQLASGLDEAEYLGLMQAEIKRVVDLQEEIGIDVIVHGEPERNDMVQYFAENSTASR